MYPTQSYRIGAVSQTTGIPVSTLRIWEKRYQAFSPIKSPAITEYLTKVTSPKRFFSNNYPSKGMPSARLLE
jgi:hypothetical protein